MTDSLDDLVKRTRAIYEAMTPEQRAEHDRLQRESWVRGEMVLGMDNGTVFCNDMRDVTDRLTAALSDNPPDFASVHVLAGDLRKLLNQGNGQ